MRIYNNKLMFAFVASATLLSALTACDMNTERRSEDQATLKGKCKSQKSFDLNKVQDKRLELNNKLLAAKADDKIVLNTHISYDEPWASDENIGKGPLYTDKTSKEINA